MLKRLTAHRIIPFIISLSFFMEAVDSTVINTAIPSISHSLQVEPVDVKVALISYLLGLAIFIPISGWLADKFGSKKTFIAALSIFTLSSLWCGFSNSLTELIIARFVQGLGGALGMPVGRLIIVRTFGRENLIAIMSQVITVAALGMMLGPVIGGFITHYFSWHWIFWVNIPVGIFAIIMSAYWMESTKPQPVPPLDKIGFALFGASLAGLTYGLSALSETTNSRAVALSIIIASIVLLIVYTVHSRHQSHPIIKTELLRFRTFRVSVIGNLFSRLGFGGVPFLVPLLLQIGLGFPPQISGLLLAPIAIGVLLAKSFAIRLLRLFGYRRLLIINTIFAGLAIWAFTRIDAQTPIYAICFLTFMYGLIMSQQYSAMNSLAYAEINPENLSAATSIMSTLQQLAQSFGVAVCALLIRQFSGNTSLTIDVIHHTFFAIGLITLISTFIYMHLKQDDGKQMIVK